MCCVAYSANVRRFSKFIILLYYVWLYNDNKELSYLIFKSACSSDSALVLGMTAPTYQNIPKREKYS